MFSVSSDRRRKLGLLAALLPLLIPGLSHAASELVLDANESKPYWSTSMVDGGMCGEIVHAVARAAGIKVAIQFEPLQRMIEDDSNNDLGNPGFFVRNQAFSAIVPIALYHPAVFSYLPNHRHHAVVHSLTDLKGHRVGLLKGVLVDRSALEQAGIVFEESYSQESLFKKLRKGRLDLVIEIDLVGKNLIHELFPDEQSDFSIDRIDKAESPIAIMISEKQPDSAAIAAALRKGLQQIRDSGEYRAIVEKHYGGILPDGYMRTLDRYTMLYSFGEEE